MSSIQPQPGLELKVYSVDHLRDLLRRRFTQYRLEAITQPLNETRSESLYIECAPVLGAVADQVAGLPRRDNFCWDIAALVLNDKGVKYQASVFCVADWNAHEIAEETVKWQSV